MSKMKPLSDWTFGEVKKLCQSMDHCYNCELRSGDTDCLVAEMVRICRRPMEWKLPEPCPLTEPELAICRAAGAAFVTRDSFSGHVLLWPSGPSPKKCQEPPFGYSFGPGADDMPTLGKLDANIFPSLSMGDCVEVPDG